MTLEPHFAALAAAGAYVALGGRSLTYGSSIASFAYLAAGLIQSQMPTEPIVKHTGFSAPLRPPKHPEEEFTAIGGPAAPGDATTGPKPRKTTDHELVYTGEHPANAHRRRRRITALNAMGHTMRYDANGNPIEPNTVFVSVPKADGSGTNEIPVAYM